jgi:hypothetical protein
VLVREALVGKNRLPAVEAIFDRLEGRPRQRLEVADITASFGTNPTASCDFIWITSSKAENQLG